ncbi:dihydrofolate reductase, partial [Escherichia coli]|nr:dihydrofolate reductase [Escherichia coli]
MKISLISAVSENGVIGSGPDIPWSVKGEQLLFKALTYNQWLLVGRKTFDSMGVLPNGTVAKLAMRQPFVLFKGLTFQKLCLPGAFRPG